MTDHAAIQPPAWVADAVFYQIFPDRFARSETVPKPGNLEAWDDPPTTEGFKGGDLRGVVERLDYLQDLGVTAIYFTPVFQSAANHRYHTHDYYRIDPLLGGDAAFRELLDAAHRRSMRVVLDGVFNHASRGFFQFNHLLENGPSSPYLDWFNVKGFPLRAYSGRRKPNYDAWWNLAALPKLNTENPAVRAFLMEVTEYWLRFGMDGWRLDVPHEIKTPGFWAEFRQRAKGTRADAYLVGEIWGDAQEWVGEMAFDAVMNYVLYRACLGYFGGPQLDTSYRPGGYETRSLSGVEFAEEIDSLLAALPWEFTRVQLNLLGSHDTPRFLNLVGENKDRLKLAVLFLMTFPGAPCIYYGDEIGLTGGKDPACRGAFPWEEERWDGELRAWVRSCIQLRHAYPALRRGTFVPVHAAEATYAFARRLGAETLFVLFNRGAAQTDVTLDVNDLLLDSAGVKDCFSSQELKARDGSLTVTLEPFSGTALAGRGPDDDS